MIGKFLDVLPDDDQNSSIDLSGSDHDFNGLDSLMEKGFFYFDHKLGAFQMNFDSLNPCQEIN